MKMEPKVIHKNIGMKRMKSRQNVNRNSNEKPDLLPFFELEKILKSMSEINFVGDIVPHAWFQNILLENGKADTHAILILSKIVYWYRPRIEVHERSEKISGYRKKFKADKLQYSIGSFAKKLGISDRQVSEALQRLDAQGIITREYRTIITSEFIKMPNMLFIVVNPEVIRRISVLNLDLLQDENEDDSEHLKENSPMAQYGGAKIAPPENTGLETFFQPEPTVVQKSHHGSANIAPPYCNNRRTYTKNTTEITSKITAAAKTPQSAFSPMANFAAAAANFKNDQNVQDATIAPPQAVFEDSYIAEKLTNNQKTTLLRSLQSLPHIEKQLSTLPEEVEAGLLDPNCFKMCEKNFPRKLRAILNSIQKGDWSAPSSLFNAAITAKTQEKQEEQQKFQVLKSQYEKHWGDYNHWTRFLEPSLAQGVSSQNEQFWLKEQQKAWKNLINFHQEFKINFPNISLPEIPTKPLGAIHV